MRFEQGFFFRFLSQNSVVTEILELKSALTKFYPWDCLEPKHMCSRGAHGGFQWSVRGFNDYFNTALIWSIKNIPSDGKF